MNRVEPGQIWSLVDAERPRYDFIITHIENGRAHGVCPGGKLYSVSVRALARGARGANLVENADGSPAVLTRRQRSRRGMIAPARPEVDKTASDFLKTSAPKGVARVGEKQQRALELHESGTTVKQLCEMYGKNKGTISAWLSRAREAREDARNLAECRRDT